MRKIHAGATNRLMRIFVEDTAALTTTDAGKTGIVYNAAGLVAYYLREGSPTVTAISLSLGVLGTYSSGGWIECDATNLPGWYEVGIPNTAFASGSKSVIFEFKGASGMVPVRREVELDVVDYQDPTTFGAGATVAAVTGNVGGNVVGSVGSVLAGVDLTTKSSPILYGPVAHAAAGSSTTITLDAGASATDQAYRWQLVKLYGGTGAGQARVVTNYVGSSKVATVDHAWITAPDSTTAFTIEEYNGPAADSTGAVTVGTMATAAKQAIVDSFYNQVYSTYSTPNTFALLMQRLNSGQAKVFTPIVLGQRITLYIGDSYLLADNRQIDILAPDAGWPDLTSATVVLQISTDPTGANQSSITITGTVVVALPVGPTQQVRFQPTSIQTLTLHYGQFDYRVIATLASGHVVTLAGERAQIMAKIV